MRPEEVRGLCPGETSGSETHAARELRKKIQAIRIKRLGWSDYVFHYVMQGLGFGVSLRGLGEERLRELHGILSGYRKHGLPVEYTYDRQGKYMYHLQKKAGWDDVMMRQYLTVTYKKTHWNLLGGKERREVIELLQGLGKENFNTEEKQREAEQSRGEELDSSLRRNDGVVSAGGTDNRNDSGALESANTKKER